MQKVKNTLLIVISLALFIVAFNAILASIDRITVRDCDRGIKTACKYVTNN